MSPSITDQLLRKQAEYSHVIAGAAVVYPREVLELLDGVDDVYIQDQQARAFIKSLRAKRCEIEASKNDSDRLRIAWKEAFNLKMASSLLSWSWLSDDEPWRPILEVATDATRKLKRLVITRLVVDGLLQEINDHGRFQRRNR
jgi:hypothetical protein